MSAGSHTQRALRDAADLGYKTWRVEYWNNFSRRRVDLFGIIDILAIKNEETLGIQVTAGSGHAAHRTKILEADSTLWWVSGENRRLEIWSYRKQKIKRGGVAYRWALRREEITAQDWVLRRATHGE